MKTAPTDLLSATRTLLQWGFWFDACLCVFLLVVLAVLTSDQASRMTLTVGANLSPEQRLEVARIIIAGVSAALGLGLPLLRQALAIVDSARSGDPFVPENARRLRVMGWLLLAINIVMTLAMSAALHRGISFPPLSFSSLLTTLMVFVIARIFDTGSRMRSDLEGTV